MEATQIPPALNKSKSVDRKFTSLENSAATTENRDIPVKQSTDLVNKMSKTLNLNNATKLTKAICPFTDWCTIETRKFHKSLKQKIGKNYILGRSLLCEMLTDL